jgi:hypothetical protein
METIKYLSVESRWIGGSERPLDLTSMVNNFRNKFLGCSLKKGTQLTMVYENHMMLLTVKNDVNGIVTLETDVGMCFV